jgi:hypothetical protein
MDPDPTPEPAPFFIDFKDAKKNSYFFLVTSPQAHHLQSKKLIILFKFCVNIFLQAILQYAQHIYEKRERSGS